VSADLHHLGPAVQGLTLLGVRGPADDAAEPHGSGELGLEGTRHVVLPHLSGAPARDVQELVVHREIDVAHQWRHRLERLERGRQLALLRRLGRNFDDLDQLPFAVPAVAPAGAAPGPDRAREILEADDYPDEAVSLCWLVGR